TVLFPGGRLSLRLFEPRYVQLLSDLSRRPPEDRRFGVVAIRRGHEVGDERLPELESVGTAALLTAAVRGAGGPTGVTFAIDSVGGERMRIQEVIEGEKPYLVAEVVWLEDPAVPPDSLAQAAARAREAFDAFVLAATGQPAPPDAVADAIPPERLAYELAQAIRLPLEERQALLEGADPVQRLNIVTRLLRRETHLFAGMRLTPVDRYGLTPPSTN
ncbi:MAG: LON peptidase substrate-binding domain-containing protein, partial [Tetrasphaera sp.]|nr:LON peptidase substrate-binding domain-containing protein [Tetrasphaera sp.]